MKISFDYFSALTSATSLNADIKSKFKTLENQINDPKTQYAVAPFRSELLRTCEDLHGKFQNIKTFVQIGIGGSSLGPEMLIRALKKSDCQFIFINNIDPDEIYDQLKSIDINHSLFYFVSKSGGTAETLAGFIILCQFCEAKGYSNEKFYSRVVFGTDPVKSELLELAKEKNIATLEVPSAVGGRFSVLTPVGFFPALFAGIDLPLLLKGAQEAKENFLKMDSDLFKSAHFLLEHKKIQKRSLTVMLPYSSKLREFSYWFNQLWAESLGKELSLNGQKVEEGFTPIAAYGATDQHSQMQLFMEGPQDKVIILLEVDHFTHDYSLKNQFVQNSFKKLSPYTLAELMKAEFNGTKMALRQKSRPFIHIKIDKLDEKNLGALILFFEMLTGLAGISLEVDPFNQPGVEAGKVFAYEWLNQLK